MLIRLTLSLLCVTTMLSAQDGALWQHYIHPQNLIGGHKTEDTQWLVSQNSVLQINLSDGSETLHHSKNTPLPDYIYDVHFFSDNEFIIIGDENKLIYWRDGLWYEQSFSLPTGEYLRNITGINADGQIIFNSARHFYRILSDGSSIRLSYSNHLGNSYITFAGMDSSGRTWIVAFPNLICIATDGSLLYHYPFTEYASSFAIDKSDNIWINTTQNLQFWHKEYELLLPVPGIGQMEEFLPGGFQVGCTDNGILIRSQEQLIKVEYEGEADFTIQDLSSYFEGHQMMPSTRFYQDENSDIYYTDYLQRLQYWAFKDEKAPTEIEFNSWLPISNLRGLATDRQGKTWVGGNNAVAYLMGGRWHKTLIDTLNFFPFSINEIVFNEQQNPILGMGSDFFFGFPETQVQEWNGSSWDTLSQAVNNVFTPFLDLEWDKDGNLWMLQMFHDVFSIRYGQQWYRFKAADMPGDVELFTCFAEDPNGGMWIGTDDGLIFYDGFRFEHTPSAEIGIISDLLPKLTILNIAIDEAGTKWLALSAEGIRKQEVGKNWEIVEFEWPSEDLPGIDKIVCGTYPELWADLSQQGVLHFDGSEWKHYNSENAGFPVTHINNIMAAPNGRVWFSTYQSVTVYDPRGQGIAPYQLPEQKKIEVYPNPGCCQYEVHWQADVTGQYSISLYNTSGQQLRRWQKEVFRAGEASFNFQDNNLPAGTYVLNVSSSAAQVGSAVLIVVP